MKLNQSTELMKNQKYAKSLKPDTMFKALQTQEGSSLFFSIGPDGAFYLSRERQADQLGWARIDLSQQFSASYNNAAVTVRTFDAAQDLTSGTIDLVIVITAGGKDYLYISLNNPNSDANWETASPAWTIVPFDDQTNIAFAGLPISDVYIAQSGSTEFIIADILTDTNTKFVSRYYVDYTKMTAGTGLAWNPHTLAGNLEAGTITSLMGRKANETFDGIYTLGAIGNEAEIIYTPMYNKHMKGKLPASISIALPDGANSGNTAMALVATCAPYTDLFVVTNGSLYYLSYSDQTNLEVPVKVYTHDLLNGVTQLHVNHWNGQLILWGLCKDPIDGVQKVFVMECQAGSETVDSTTDAAGTGWKCPIPILFDVLNVSTFINNQLSASVIFAHLDAANGGDLVKLSEDPATSAWNQRRILVPEVNLILAYDVNTYTTHLEFTDDTLVPQGNIPVAFTSTHPVSVYINDIYYTLDTTTPLSVNTDGSGIITIVQEVDSIGAVSYFVSADGLASTSVNPLTDILGKFSGFTATSDDDADPTRLNVTVTNENGESSQLVASNISDAQKKSAVAGISAFVSVNGNVDPGGKVQDNNVSGSAAAKVASVRPVSAKIAGASVVGAKVAGTSVLSAKVASVKPAAAKRQISGVSFVKGKEGYYEGVDEMAKMGLVVNADGSLSIQMANGKLGSFLGAIESKAGHILKWMKSEAHKIETVVKDVEGDIVNFYMTIEGEVFHFVVKCLRDIADGIHAMLSAVETSFEDIVKWIGMIFNFTDIKNTHKVLNNIFSIYLDHIVSDVDDLQGQCADAFATLLAEISKITGLPDETRTYSGVATPTGGSKSPSANWGNHQLKSNSDSTAANLAPENTADDPTGGLMSQLATDLQAASQRFDAIKDQVNQLANNAHTMTAIDLIKAAIGIVLEVLVDGTETVVSFAITVLQTIIKSVKEALDTPLQIPVISYLYEKAIGDGMTALGLATFLAAIPATVVMKVVTDSAPFPAGDASTLQLLNAKTLSDIQAVFTAPATPAISTPAAATPAIANPATATPATATLLGAGPDLHTPLLRAAAAMNIAAATGAIVLSLITLKSNWPDPTGNVVDLDPGLTNKLALINSAFYICYASPDIFASVTTTDTDAATKLNTFLTTVACIKAVADASTVKWMTQVGEGPNAANPQKYYRDNISPWLDGIINVAWLAPPAIDLAERLISKKVNVNDIASFVGNVTFDLSGILAPVLWLEKTFMSEGVVKRATILATTAGIDLCNLVWGGASLMISFDGLAQPNS